MLLPHRYLLLATALAAQLAAPALALEPSAPEGADTSGPSVPPTDLAENRPADRPASASPDARPASPDTPPRASVFAQVDAFVWSTSAVALNTGMVLGGGADARRPVGSRGLFLGVRLAGGTTTEYTSDWELHHLHGLATLDGGFERRLGAGSVRAQLGLGGFLVLQRGQRHQYERLKAAGLDELRRDGWSLGPYASFELGAAVVVLDPWRLFVQLGPSFTLQQVSGERTGRWLFSSGLGVGRAF